MFGQAYKGFMKYGLRWRIRQRLTAIYMRRMLDTKRLQEEEDNFERQLEKAGRPRQIFYFHQTDDPYSALTAQILPELEKRYEVEVLPHLVPPPSADMMPEAQLAIAYSRVDASRIAPFYNLSFTDSGHIPPSRETAFASRILASCGREQFMTLAAKVSQCLWADDTEGLKKLASGLELVSADKVQQTLHENAALRKQMGHYNGAMFHYGGVWYWGIDRLLYLEARLERQGAKRKNAPSGEIAPLAKPTPAPKAHKTGKQVVDYFFSLRSPYTAISVNEALALPESLPVTLNVRPILPMIMRGLPVPMMKGRYIMPDTKREADRKGIAFGNMLDPVGPPVERAYSLLPYLEAEGKAGEFLRILLNASWGEGRDIFSRRFLRGVIEDQLHLSWEKAAPLLDTDDWREKVEENRQALVASGCWGAPSFCLRGEKGEPDFTVWGQDRIWLLREEIIRRAAAQADSKPT